MMNSDSLNGDVMADQQNDEDRGSTDNQATYARFMTTTKWAVVFIVGALILMALLLA